MEDNEDQTRAGIELSEEEKLALQSMALEEGLSDSASSHTLLLHTGSVKTKKNRITSLPRPVHRNAMGGYVPSPGEKPLSSLDTEVRPGPQEYDPQWTYTRTTYPSYTLGEKSHGKRKRGTPGPAKYNVGGNLLWGKCKTITIKNSTKTKSDRPGPGPDKYSRMPKTLKGGPKYTIGKKVKDGKIHCLQSSLVMTLNKDTPGCDFNEPETRWLERPQTFGVKVTASSKTPGPGPKYNTRTKPGVKGATLNTAGDRSDLGLEDGPGPADYKPPATFGQGRRCPFGILCGRTDVDKRDIPGPDTYHRAGFRLDEPGWTMKYRWFDTKPEIRPGPASYKAEKLTAGKGPAFSMARATSSKDSKTLPGPGDYDLFPPQGQGRSFGRKWPHLDKSETGPAPNSYQKLPLPVHIDPMPTAPAYSIKGKYPVKKGDRFPGPNKYRVPSSSISDRGVVMGVRIPRKEGSVGPGPVLPLPETEVESVCLPCLSATGATLKGRHSPHKYSGLRDSGLLPPTPKEIAGVPLLG